ncbi:hypothetical protein [Ensifer adhaerens]|uniref:hypothetical protein n=1 Tax=Ensifer adhaerens TaxID=106592 RepID=UPI0009902747|nr:hypothetical protein [Ensifer adhaerens]
MGNINPAKEITLGLKMNDILIPRTVIDVVAGFATLGGIVLGFDTIALAIRDNGSVPWAVFGLVVACTSGLSLYVNLVTFFGDWKTAKARRMVGGLTCLAIFLLFAATIPFFRY